MIQTQRFDTLLYQTFTLLTGCSLDEAESLQPGKVVVELSTLKDIFCQLRTAKARDEEMAAIKQREIEAQLEELRHVHAKLEAEFESKFEKNKTISLTVPTVKGLHIYEEKEDSIKSFRPESDDDSEDVRRREQDLRDKLAKQKEEEKNRFVEET